MLMKLQKKIYKNTIHAGRKSQTIHTENQKPNALLNLINHEPEIDKTILYAKDPYESKYESQ